MIVILRENLKMSAVNVTKDNWWALVSSGVATLIFGVTIIFWPGLTLLVVLYLFSAYALINGVLNIMSALGVIGIDDTWFLAAALGVFEVGVSVYLLRHVTVKFSTLILLIGFTLIARGVIEAVCAYFGEGANPKVRALSYLGGLGALAAGIVVLLAKQQHGVSFVWLLGVYGIVAGTLELAALSNKSKLR
jgi:uncharacterized membrane protein HdeD (DUF308 family)